MKQTLKQNCTLFQSCRVAVCNSAVIRSEALVAFVVSKQCLACLATSVIKRQYQLTISQSRPSDNIAAAAVLYVIS